MPATLTTAGYERWLTQRILKTANGWIIQPTVTATTTSNYFTMPQTTTSVTKLWFTNQTTGWYTPTAADIWEAQAYEQDRWYTPAGLQRPAAPAIIRSRTPEQEAELEMRRRIHQEEMAAANAIREAAAKRAEELLLANLTPEQQATYRANNWFIVEGGKTKTKYRIRCKDGFVGNVDVIADNKVTHRLCAHVCTSQVPTADNLLAQKAMLEWDEESFVRIANRHPARAA